MRLPFNRWPPRGDASPAADSAYGCKATRATKPVVLGTPPKEAAALPALPSVTLVAGLLATALRAELGRPMDRRDRWPPPSLSIGVSRDAKTPALALAAPNGSCGVGCMGDASTGDATDSPDAELSDRMRDLGGETHAGSTCVSDRDGSCGGDTLCSRSSEPGGGSCLRGVPRCSGRAGDGGGDRREGASWNCNRATTNTHRKRQWARVCQLPKRRHGGARSHHAHTLEARTHLCNGRGHHRRREWRERVAICRPPVRRARSDGSRSAFAAYTVAATGQRTPWPGACHATWWHNRPTGGWWDTGTGPDRVA